MGTEQSTGTKVPVADKEVAMRITHEIEPSSAGEVV